MASEPCGSENEGGPCVLPAGHGPRHVDRHGGHWRDDLEVPISDEQRARIVADYLARARARRLGDDPGEVARLTALLAELDAEVARLREAAQAYIDAYDAALKAPLQYAQAEEYCHAQRYNLRAALAARGGES